MLYFSKPAEYLSICWAIWAVQFPNYFIVGLSTTTTTTTTVLRPFVWDYLSEPVPEETLTHPPSWSSSNLYQLLPSTTIHSILLVQITCLAIFLHNLFPCPLWSTSWSGALHLIFHTFLHPISVSFCSTCPYHYSLFCCSINIISSIPSLSLNSLLGTLSYTLTMKSSTNINWMQDGIKCNKHNSRSLNSLIKYLMGDSDLGICGDADDTPAENQLTMKQRQTSWNAFIQVIILSNKIPYTSTIQTQHLLFHFAWGTAEAKCILTTAICLSVPRRIPTLLLGGGVA